MSDIKKSIALVMVTALITSAGTGYLLEQTPQANIKEVKQQTLTIKKSEQAIDKGYTIAYQKLQKENDSLKKVVQVHKEALHSADEKVSVLESKVSQLAEKVNAVPDTVKEKVSDCDSLSRETTALITEEDKKDSLCNETVSSLTAQVTEKDSVIGECNQSYSRIKLVLDSSVQQQQYLTDELNAMNKHIRHKAFQSKLLTIGVMILTGVSATLLLESKL